MLQTYLPLRPQCLGMRDGTVPAPCFQPTVNSSSNFPLLRQQMSSLMEGAKEKGLSLSSKEENCFLYATIEQPPQRRRSSILFDVFNRTEQLLDVMRWNAAWRDWSKELSFQTHRALATEASCWAASFGGEGARRGDYTVSTVFARRWNIDISVQRDFRTIWFSFAATATQWWTSGRKMQGCLIHERSKMQAEPINIYMECSTDWKPA